MKKYNPSFECDFQLDYIPVLRPEAERIIAADGLVFPDETRALDACMDVEREGDVNQGSVTTIDDYPVYVPSRAQRERLVGFVCEVNA
jgi:hypothetical protein